MLLDHGLNRKQLLKENKDSAMHDAYLFLEAKKEKGLERTFHRDDC